MSLDRTIPSWWQAPGVRAVVLAVLDDESSDAAVAASVLERSPWQERVEVLR